MKDNKDQLTGEERLRDYVKEWTDDDGNMKTYIQVQTRHLQQTLEEIQTLRAKLEKCEENMRYYRKMWDAFLTHSTKVLEPEIEVNIIEKVKERLEQDKPQ